MLIAQITDLHLRSDGRPLKNLVDSVDALDKCIDTLNAQDPRPDLILATGDLVNKAHKQDYQLMRQMFERFERPVYVIPGNHDDRDLMRDAFGDLGYLPEDGPFLHYTLEDYDLRMIGLDTFREGSDGGEFCQERRDWLDARLSEQPDRPTLIFMHHPPFKSGIGFMDKSTFIGAEEMEAIVRRHSQVVRVVCGHLHRQISVGWGGTVGSVASSVAFQVALDLKEGAKSSFVLEPAACPLYLWNDDGLIAHTATIGDFGPWHPFVRDPL